MSDRARSETEMSVSTGEVYSQQDNPAFEAWLATKTASREGGFFLPHLRPGMRVLDVGSGPGSITVGLAEVVAPGEVIGVDLQPALVEQARARAAKHNAANVRFEVANVYDLPYRSGSFDAVF